MRSPNPAVTSERSEATRAPGEAANRMQSASGIVNRVRDRLEKRPEFFTLFLLIALGAFVGFINPDFFQVATFFDIARSSTVIGLFALGVFVILAAGGIDVSFTAIAALSMYSVTKLVSVYFPETPILLVFIASTLGGALLGLVNGLLVHELRAPPLIVTIGTQYLFRGLLLTFIGTVWIIDLPVQMDSFGKIPLISFVTERATKVILPAFVLVLLFAALLTWWILNRTLMGKAIFAVGGSPAIAERLGYSLRSVHFFIFSYTGALAGLAGMIHVCSNRLANPFDLVGIEIDVIAAVVLGGARITGGTGTVIGTVLGVFLVVMVNNVLIMAGVPSTWQRVVVGSFILVAGIFFVLRKKQ